MKDQGQLGRERSAGRLLLVGDVDMVERAGGQCARMMVGAEGGCMHWLSVEGLLCCICQGWRGSIQAWSIHRCNSKRGAWGRYVGKIVGSMLFS